MDGPTLDTSRGSTPLPAARSGLEILFGQLATRRERKKKRKFQYLDLKLGGRRRRRGKEKRKNPLLSNLSLPFLSCSPFEQVHGTNEVRVARCNKRLESGPSHVGTSAKPVLRSLGLIGRCWLPNCRAPPLLPSRRGKENCKTVSRENRESLLPIENSNR